MNAFETKNSVLSSVVPVIKKFDPGPPEKCANKFVFHELSEEFRLKSLNY